MQKRCDYLNHTNKFHTGFTLVELIVVILLIGILSISIAPRFFSVSSYESRRAADEVLSAVRHAQQIAMNRSGDIEFILSASDYTVQVSGGINLRSPDGLVPYKRQFDGVSAIASTVRFNALGQPVDATNTPLSNNTDLSIGSTTIRIEANTGYAHIQ